MTLELSLILGSAFGFLAGAMAFLITFDEYRKHQMAGWHLWKGALTAGAFAFAVFMLLSLAAGVWLKGWRACYSAGKEMAFLLKPPSVSPRGADDAYGQSLERTRRLHRVCFRPSPERTDQ